MFFALPMEVKSPVRQFPNADAHYWVINETPWDGDEMVVDLHMNPLK